VAITGLLIVWLGPKPDPALNWCQENASTVHAYAEGYHTDFETACRLIYRTLVSPGPVTAPRVAAEEIGARRYRFNDLGI
jgi:hypothetical protein